MKRKQKVAISIICLVSMLPVFYSCSKEDNASKVEECILNFTDSSAVNPKAAQYQAIIDDFTKEKGLPGIVALVYTPLNGVWIGTSGYSQIENNIRMQPCDIFMSASVAKTYHAVLTLKMQEEGLLSIDDKIDKYLPREMCDKLPNGHKATIKSLLNHSSGIPNPTTTLSFMARYINNLKEEITPEEYISYIYKKDPVGEVGEKFTYSDANYILIALIIDKIYGNHAIAMSDFIINPNKLDYTFYRNETEYKNRAHLVNSYADFYGEKILRNVSDEERIFNESNIGHDGFKYSAYDSYLFFRELFIDKTILNQESLDLMLNNDADLESFYINERALLGVFILDEPGYVSISHEGQTIGSANFSAYYPEKNAIIVICSNFGGVASPVLYKAMFDRESSDDCLLKSMEKAAF
jgi:D-alanyl-D-alanine carboxypeptidase